VEALYAERSFGVQRLNLSISTSTVNLPQAQRAFPTIMNDDILDAQAIGGSSPEFDPKTITRINDAKIEANDNLRRMLMGRWVLIVLILLNVFSLYVAFNSLYESIGTPGTSTSLSPQVLAGGIKVLLISAIFTVLPLVVLAIIFRVNPILCLALALGFYLLGQVISFLNGGAWAVIQGYGVKAAIITALTVPLYCGIRWRQAAKKLRELGVPPSELIQLTKKLKPLGRTKRPKKEN